MWVILLEKGAIKALDKAPREIQEKFEKWKDILQFEGPQGLFAIQGFKDHALRGEWEGARASRLNNKWRVIYVVFPSEIKVLVMEVTAHDYRKKS